MVKVTFRAIARLPSVDLARAPRVGSGRIAAQHFLVKAVYASVVRMRFGSFFRRAGEHKKMT